MDPTNTVEESSTDIFGITLHVERSREHPAQLLTYHKSLTRVIIIGRKSSHARHAAGQEVDRALFRCPVVSRRHAKITFTEYGNAYIMDLNSHHGTHILRPGDTVSKQLKAETPTVLADGDVVTFGKTVGHDETLVHPITVRVSLLCGSKPTSVRSELRRSPSVPHLTDKESAHGSSGRYGIYVSSDNSSSSSSSSGDSDVEEISPPPSSRAISSLSRPLTLPVSARLSNASGRLRLLERLLPPIQPSCVLDLRSVSPETEQHPYVQREVEAVHEAAEDDVSDRFSHPPESSLPAVVDRHDALHEPPVVGAWPGSPLPPVGLSAYEFDLIEAGFSLFAGGSHAVEGTDNTLDKQGRPSENAESDQRAEDVVHVAPPRSVADDAASHTAQAGDDAGDALTIADESPYECQPESLSPASVAPEGLRLDIEFEYSEPTRYMTPQVQPNVTLSELEGQVNLATNDITMLRIHRRRDEERFDEHVRETKDRLEALDQRMQELNGRVTNHVAANYVVTTGAASRVDDLQASVDWLRAQVAVRAPAEQQLPPPYSDTSDSVDAIKALMEDIRALKEQSERQMAQDLEAIRAAREQAEAAFRALAEASAQQAATSISRKRKRSETDEVEGEDEDEQGSSVIQPADFLPPPTKRRRTGRIMLKVVQTATVAAVGAMATWTALAFS